MSRHETIQPEAPPDGPTAAPSTLGAVQRLSGHRVVPVATLYAAADARPLAEALADGELPCAEVTLRTDVGLAAIERASAVEGFTVGAGTVLSGPQARRAIDAGAQFIVSPGLSSEVVEAATAAGVPVIPGVATATEVMSALHLGLDTVKFFPAATSGGPAGVRALGAAFPALRFMPTGGITPDTLGSYLEIASVIAVGGTWIAPRDLITQGDFAAITRLARAAVQAATPFQQNKEHLS